MIVQVMLVRPVSYFSIDIDQRDNKTLINLNVVMSECCMCYVNYP